MYIYITLSTGVINIIPFKTVKSPIAGTNGAIMINIDKSLRTISNLFSDKPTSCSDLGEDESSLKRPHAPGVHRWGRNLWDHGPSKGADFP